jgi:hypothetical protein
MRALKASVLLLLCFALWSATLLLWGAGKPSGPSETPMIVQFRDLLNPLDRITSDGSGPYSNGVDSVRAVVDQRGDIDLGTSFGQGAEVRKLSFDFSQAIEGAVAPFQKGLEAAFLSTNAGGLLTMTVGDSKASELQVRFTYGGNNWFVRFMPSYDIGTNNVTITHPTGSTWVIDTNSAAIAQLVSMPIKGKAVLSNHGRFVMPLSITLTKK